MPDLEIPPNWTALDGRRSRDVLEVGDRLWTPRWWRGGSSYGEMVTSAYLALTPPGSPPVLGGWVEDWLVLQRRLGEDAGPAASVAELVAPAPAVGSVE